jgi:hypothetical protein
MSVRKLKTAIAQEVNPEFVSVDQAQLLTGISKWSWRSFAYKGRIESVKIGSRLLIPIAEIRRVIAEGRRPRIDGLAAGEPRARNSHRDIDVITTDTAVQARA